jgi:hypothetical protein
LLSLGQVAGPEMLEPWSWASGPWLHYKARVMTHPSQTHHFLMLGTVRLFVLTILRYIISCCPPWFSCFLIEHQKLILLFNGILYLSSDGVYAHNEILLGHKKEWNSIIWGSVDEPGVYYIRYQKPGTKGKHSQAREAHTSNPSYSGGRDQEDCGSRPALINSSQDPILKKIHHRKGLAEWLKW